VADFERFYLDTNVLIAIAELIEQANQRQIEVMDKIAAGVLLAASSEIALSECLVKPIVEGNSELVALYKAMLGGDSEIVVMPVSRDVLIEAANVRARHKIKLPDAIHFATAQLSGCSSFITNDQRLASLWGKNAIIWEAL
jgi:predicted nucleic acid-binding protein